MPQKQNKNKRGGGAVCYSIPHYPLKKKHTNKKTKNPTKVLAVRLINQKQIMLLVLNDNKGNVHNYDSHLKQTPTPHSLENNLGHHSH